MASKQFLYGDIYLPNAIWSAGVFTHGVIRQAAGLQLGGTYTQTAAPTDIAVGSPLVINWNPTLNNTTPTSATSLYGPRALANIEGITRIGANQNRFAFSPIGFGDMHRVKNSGSGTRTITPGWVFMSARTTYADTNTAALQKNDIADGTASFVDAQTFMTANSATLDGTTNAYEIISVLSMPFLLGNSHVSKRTAFKVLDMNVYLGVPGTDLSSTLGAAYVPGADAGLGVVDAQYGIDIPYLTQATVNVGIQNASATVNPMLAVSVTAVGTTLPINATVLAVTATSAMTSTAAPLLAAGLNGQEIVIVNVGANAWTLQDEAVLASTGLYIEPVSPNVVVLNQYESITLRYSTSSGKWLKVAKSNPIGSNVQAVDGTASHGLTRMNVTALGPGVALYGNTGDTQPKVTLTGTGISIGPGGSTATDFKVLRTGSAAAAVTGVLTMTSPAITTPTGIVKGDVGLGNVDNTSNATERAATATLTNHAVAPRESTITSNATWAPNADTTDIYTVTAQAAAATTISNPSGTPVQGQKLLIRVKDNATARALTWSGTQWRASTDLPLPTTTVLSKTMYLGFMYNSTDTKWDLLAVLGNI